MRASRAVHYLPAESQTQREPSSLDLQSKQLSNSHVLIYDKREREDRRKNKIKPLIDTRSGRDRRYDKESRSIDIEAWVRKIAVMAAKRYLLFLIDFQGRVSCLFLATRSLHFHPLAVLMPDL